MRGCVRSRNLKYEEAMARVGPQRRRNNNNVAISFFLLDPGFLLQIPRTCTSLYNDEPRYTPKNVYNIVTINVGR